MQKRDERYTSGSKNDTTTSYYYLLLLPPVVWCYICPTLVKSRGGKQGIGLMCPGESMHLILPRNKKGVCTLCQQKHYKNSKVTTPVSLLTKIVYCFSILLKCCGKWSWCLLFGEEKIEEEE